MTEGRAIAKARVAALAAPADRAGCIRIRRADVLNMLDLIAAQSTAIETARTEILALRKKVDGIPPRFFDRIGGPGVAATPRKVRT